MKLKDKRGDVPIMILVIGIVGICGLAVLSFIISEKVKLKPDELGIEVFEKLYSDVEKFEFYEGVYPNEAIDKIKTVENKAELRGGKLYFELNNSFLKVEYTQP